MLACGDKILLAETKNGHLSTPKAPSDDNTLSGLQLSLESRGVFPNLDHLYAVYQTAQCQSHSIIYLGTVSGTAPSGMRYVERDRLPLNLITSDAERSMLARYQREFRHGRFGIYHGTDTAGIVHVVTDQTEYNI